MSNVKSILSKRFEKGEQKTTKMDQLAAKTSSGSLSSFSGVFKVVDLSPEEKASLEDLLKNYTLSEETLSRDLTDLSTITSELKAINNQAIILHGERIKKAQNILKTYKDGAFSAWLLATYGNRQTPYNFLQYYELYIALSEQLQRSAELMPKQVIYTLASREASLEQKKQFILGYQGETKDKLLSLLRELFPLEEQDRRSQRLPKQALRQLKSLSSLCKKNSFKPTSQEKAILLALLEEVQTLVLQK